MRVVLHLVELLQLLFDLLVELLLYLGGVAVLLGRT
jgi:hypothetical protein